MEQDITEIILRSAYQWCFTVLLLWLYENKTIALSTKQTWYFRNYCFVFYSDIVSLQFHMTVFSQKTLVGSHGGARL